MSCSEKLDDKPLVDSMLLMGQENQYIVFSICGTPRRCAYIAENTTNAHTSLISRYIANTVLLLRQM
jgi:hypothetical protein